MSLKHASSRTAQARSALTRVLRRLQREPYTPEVDRAIHHVALAFEAVRDHESKRAARVLAELEAS